MKNDYEIRGDVTAIFLNRKDGTVLETIISTNDLEKVKELPNTWCVTSAGQSGGWYVYGNFGDGRKVSKIILLHRFILDVPSGLVVDHINHNTTDNTRLNLRIVTRAQNMQNLSLYKTSKTGIRGVSWDNKSNKWVAKVCINNNRITIGYFDDLIDAELEVTKARKKYMPFSVENA